VLQKPIPHQGVMNTQQNMHPAPPQMGQYQNPGNLLDHNILLTSEEEIIFQMRSRQYNAPHESTPTTLEESPSIVVQTFMIPPPNAKLPFVSLTSHYDGMSTTLGLGRHTITV
jgi:hypothetical protein